MRFVLSLILLSLAAISAPAMALFGNSNSTPSFGNSNNTFVPVDEAFPFNAFQQGNNVLIDWQVKEGYYLYQHSISVSGENVTLGDVEIRDGEPHNDEFFGEVNIYTTPLFVEVPLSDYQEGARLIVQYQGCAKAGFCYPPETRVVDLTSFTTSASSTSSTTSSTQQVAK